MGATPGDVHGACPGVSAQAPDPSDIGSLPAAGPESTRHLLEQPGDNVAICTYKRTGFDLESYLDPQAPLCKRCEAERDKRADSRTAT